jgi:hypothetical protein
MLTKTPVQGTPVQSESNEIVKSTSARTQRNQTCDLDVPRDGETSSDGLEI